MCKTIARLLLLSVALLLGWSLATTPVAYAQSVQGAIVGNVTDPTGAVVPNITVSVTNVSKLFTRTAITNDIGYYQVPNLEPGTYDVLVEASGFKRYLNRGIPVAVRESVRVDIKLEVGQVTQEVTVAAEASVLRTEDAKLTSTYTARQFDLPLNVSWHGYGSNALNAAILPGLHYTRTFGSESSGMFVTGSRGPETQVNVQGIKQTGYGDAYAQPTSTVGELKVERFLTNAEYATPATIDTTFRSGTSKYHAGLTFDLRNTKFKKAKWYSPKPTVGTPSYAMVIEFNGPAYIPKVMPSSWKDKTFFFFSHERNKRTTFTRPVIRDFPTVAMRNGDFSGLRLGGLPVQIYDPLTGEAFPNATIPSARIPQVSRNILALFPQPNQGDPNSTFQNFKGEGVEYSGIGVRGYRFDHNLTDKQLLTFTLGQSMFPQNQDIGTGGGGSVLGLIRQVSNMFGNNPAFGWTYSISPTVVNEFRVGALRYLQNTSAGDLGMSARGLDFLTQMGITGLTPPDAEAWPTISISGIQAIAGIGQTKNAKTYGTLFDNLSVQSGKHTIKLGMNARNYIWNQLGVPGDAYGNYSFTGRISSGANFGVTCPTGYTCGVGFADFLLGLPDTVSLSQPRPEISGRFKEFGFYIQDKWNVTPKLTISYGIREDFWTVPYDKHDLYYNFDPANGGRIVVPSELSLASVAPGYPSNVPIVTAAQAGYPSRLRKVSKFNLSPRFSFAWRPWGEKTVIRSGYGIYHDPLTFDTLMGTFTGGPYAAAQSFRNEWDTQTSSWLLQWPRAIPQSVGPTVAIPGSLGFTAINPKSDIVPYVQQWGLTLEQEVMRDTRVSLGYIGSKATQLWYRRAINVPEPSTIPFSQDRRPLPFYSGITLSENGGNQTFHSLEAMLYRRMRGGLQIEGGWTWLAAINDVAMSGSALGGGLWYPFKRDKGREEQVQDHVLKFNAVWELPMGRGRALLSDSNRVINAILGGWTTSHHIDIRSGDHLTPYVTGDPAGIGFSTTFPDRTCNGNVPNSQKNFWHPAGDPNCFPTPANNIGRFGNSTRGVLKGHPGATWDMGIFKDFPIYETLKFRLGWYTVNIFNWNSYGWYNMNARSSNAFASTFGHHWGNYNIPLYEFQAKLSF